ncbi:TetR/AcrR family transcriptional regulator [Thauera sinica]|uniref:TetR/AcrR family transcriptional regulator n=1 Tax=Thauera sinica TaxID=2665146 RepID=A0ABW1AYG0_9RHOO|nr:TetR/AcrR family transcriptional regulator [Thauera sp. K11]ATE58766.1 hypothetical protein CCZ27_01275 [Thauera sp. K11]
MENRTDSPGERRSGAELRRDQILCAAKACFSEYGFHGTSIAVLAKSSGMSVGHIYHYFQNKEAIVEAIAEEAMEEILEVHSAILNCTEILDGLISHVADVSIEFSRLENARLRLEIMSEATRNARLGRIVQDCDQRTRKSMLEILKCINESRSVPLSDAEIEIRFELLSSLVSGFLMRAVKGCHVDENELRQSLYQVLRFILVSNVSEQAAENEVLTG